MSIEYRNGKPRVRWRDLDGSEHTRKCSTRRTAEQLEAQIKAAKDLGRDWAPQDTTGLPDLEEIFRAYLRAKQRRLKPNTLAHLNQCLLSFLKYLRAVHPRGTLWPELLTRASLERFFDWLVDGTCSQYTAVTRVYVVSRVWDWAFDHDEYGEYVPRPRKPDLPSVAQAAVTVAPTWSEMDQMIAAADGRGLGGWYGQFFRLMRYTGLRKQQAMGMLWTDFDLERALMTVRPELCKTRAEAKGRTVPISRHLVEEMAGWGRREGYVIATGGESRRPDTKSSKVMLAAAARERFPGEGEEVERQRQAFTAQFPSVHHGFRHGFITGLQVLGVPERTVQVLVGHAGGGTTRKHYTDLWQLLPELQDAVARVPRVGEAVTSDLDVWRRRRAE